VLVSRKDMKRIEPALRRAGLERGSISRPLHQRLFYERLWVRREPGMDVLVDLHHRVVPWPLMRDATSRILARRERVEGLWAPSAIDRVLVTAAHHAKEAPGHD